MNINKSMLAKKYAQAFLNTYPHAVAAKEYEGFIKAVDHLKKQTAFFIILSVPSLTFDQRLKALHQQLDTFHLPSEIDRLLRLLLTQHRIALLPDILKQIILVYEQWNNIMEFKLSSSSTLTKNQEKALQSFITAQTGYISKSSTKVDPALVAGLRLQSNTLLWEYSIAKQLRTIKESLGQ
jgi:ATP synthase F1 delta subunit